MGIITDIQYAKQISYRLDGWQQKRTSPFLATFRCKICGDSDKKKRKKRGYIYQKSGKLNYFCHNCNASMSFGSFLKWFDVNMFKQYAVESFGENHSMIPTIKNITHVIPATKKYVPNIFESLPNIKELAINHSARVWCENRCLPIESFDFYLAENFIEWANGNTNKFKAWKGKDHSRIIIPWFDRDKKIIGWSARCWNSDEDQKYYRIFVDEEVKEHFFGLDRINESKPVYVLEGEIDSLMIPNAVAVANGKLQTYMNKQATYIPDLDTRNPHIMKNVRNMIDLGLKVCMLPENLPGKDLNEFRQAGLTQDEILHIINKNTFQGLSAQLQFTKWSKV